MKSRLKHLLTVILLFGILFVALIASGALPWFIEPPVDLDPYAIYGTVPTVLIYILRILTLVPLPLAVSNFIGIILGNTHPDPPKLMTSQLLEPIYFRVVTRGTYPELVKRNVKRNVELCTKVGLTNFIFEIVTDHQISFGNTKNVREVVVPSLYKTSQGALYKARALQYSLEDDVTTLTDSDWVVHLDEETLLTESSVAGVTNFIHSGQYEFGQGVITYASDSIVSWVTTLADLVRVGADYGNLQFTLGVLHKPIFSWKGSFIVANAGAEKRVSFDFGPEGSMAEDCFFALTAWKEGYRFGFVEGEMLEKSTFSVMDFILQRKRWIQGISLTFLSNKIPLKYKLGISVMILSWAVMPVTSLNLILVPLFPVPISPALNCLVAFSGGVVMFLFILGAIKSFSLRRHGLLKCLTLYSLTLIIAPVSMILESIGVILAVLSMKAYDFHIVRKDLDRVLAIHV